MESLQPARRGAFWFALVLCLLACAARCADLLFWTDAATGYPLRGPALLRCGILLALAAVLRLLAAATAPRPLALHQPCRGLAAVLALTGLCAVPAGFGGAVWEQALACAAAAGFLLLGWRAAGRGGRAALGLLPGPWLLWVAAQRALAAPAAVGRLGNTLRVLSAVAALVFYAALLRRLYVPAQPAVPTLFTAGFLCFLCGTCMELPQALFELAGGVAQPGAVAQAAFFACLGGAGLACAWQATGPNYLQLTFTK